MRTMPKLLIKLTPLAPYFFGGERIFEIGDGNRHYFIHSIDTPSQTTLFGALRYIGIRSPEKGFRLNDEDKFNIGASSFDLTNQGIADFGGIKRISPLYIFSQGDGYMIRTPLDHINTPLDHINGQETYSRFERYSGPIRTTSGERWFPLDYNAKHGLADSWLSLADGKIYNGLFEGIAQVGIDKKNKKQAFFRKEFKRLKAGFSFVFFADVGEGFTPYNKIVYLGQGKSAFQADWDWGADEPKIPAGLIRGEMVYAQSDAFISCGVNELYETCNFVCAATRDFRVFVTDYDRAAAIATRYKKSGNIKLVQAGSVFWPNNAEAFVSRIHNCHASIAGFNQIIIGGESQ